MLVYLNRGLILEQAVAALLHDYFDALRLEKKYPNFHVSVTTDHPFAEMFTHEGLNAADAFPAVVVTTADDGKPEDFFGLEPHIEAVGLDAADVEEITRTTAKARMPDGEEREMELSGLCKTDSETLAAINAVIEKRGRIYGYSVRTRRKERLSIEIWAENNRLKNELYEHTRLFVACSLRHFLGELYPFHDTALFDETVSGQRGNNYSLDFDTLLCGSHIGFEVNYCVEQLVLDTEAEQASGEIIMEVINHYVGENGGGYVSRCSCR